MTIVSLSEVIHMLRLVVSNDPQKETAAGILQPATVESERGQGNPNRRVLILAYEAECSAPVAMSRSGLLPRSRELSRSE
jgi:hypothetical protein